MRSYKEKMSDFVGRLWNTPAVEQAPLQEKERQILSFIKENTQELKSTLAQPDYFPDLPWREVEQLLAGELAERVIRKLEPDIEESLNRLVRPALMERFYAPHEESINPVMWKEFLLTLLREREIRHQYILVVETIRYRFFERYLSAIVKRRGWIYEELVEREQLDSDPAVLADTLCFASLFQPLALYEPEGKEHQDSSAVGSKKLERRRNFDTRMERLGELLHTRLGHIPPWILRMGVLSLEDPGGGVSLPASSRLMKILINRAASYDPGLIRERGRGAESPDTSWFNINRRTSVFHGYDARFLEELYEIAREEGW